jgi:UDP-glucose 4-epimerase
MLQTKCYNEHMNILITGGAGYIGTHTIIELIAKGHDIIVVDMLSNSSTEALRRVEKITGKAVPLFNTNLMDKTALRSVFQNNKIDVVMHLAGFKAVGESVAHPLAYYRNNIDATLTLCELMNEFNVKKLIFSSSATVYGDPEELPLKETSRTGVGITNPYGQTKFMIEQILRDMYTADNTMEIAILRYFNPVGAHESGLIGENPNGIPNNLLPYIAQVAIGKLEKVNVFGDDYDTPDGTCIRDYIHVVDLAKGHVAALEHSKPGAEAYNLATGNGVSVLELIAAFGKAAGKEIPYQITARRAGDNAASYASPAKAGRELGWFTEKSIDDACADSWRWQSQNPNGFSS